MPKCPNCGHCFVKQKIAPCPRHISITTATKGITSYDWDMKSKNDKELFNKMYVWIEKKPISANFRTRDIIRDFNEEWISDNNKVLKALAYFICLGKIERVKYDVTDDLCPTDNRTNRGHEYRKTNKMKCEYLSTFEKKGFDIVKCEYFGD